MNETRVFIAVLFLALSNGLAGRQITGTNQELLRLFESGDTAGILKILESDPQRLRADLGEGKTPLHYAAYTGNEIVFDYLMKRGADLQAKDKRGLTPVWFAVSGSRPAMLKKLIALGADLGVKDAQGNTLLHRAVQTGNAELVKILLDHLGGGFKIDEKNARGMTPLLEAVDFKNTETARALILRGADVNAVSAEGLSALQLAAKKGESDLIDRLIARKADLGVVEEKTGKTLLHEAALNGNSEVVKKLLAAGVPKNAKDKNGLTALSYAQKYGNKAAADVLKKSGVEDIPWVAKSDESPFLPQGRLLAEGRIFAYPICYDFDGDGRLDIVVSDFLNPARIIFNDAGFEFKKVVPLTSSPEMATSGHGVDMGDFNGHGRVDLFLVYNNRYPARLLFGDGRGGFKDSGRGTGTLPHGTSTKASDIDGDKDLDVFITYYPAGGRLFLNDGTGVMVKSKQVLPERFAVGDVDGDGDVDLVSPPAYRSGEPAFIWLNEKGRFIRQERPIDVGKGIHSAALADVDADGDLDLFAWGESGEGAGGSLWMNDGRGGFRRSEQAFDSGSIAVDDIDGDGDLDLLSGRGDRTAGNLDIILFINTLRGK